jgi:uncharacterized protein (DUF1501 family)
LVALGATVPGFLARTARAADAGKDRILVVLEMNGGNDGLNTLVPYANEHYQRARPTLGLKKEEVVKIDDMFGLNPGLRNLDRLRTSGQLSIVQGVGYPNPDRSHFESMDIWQSADPKRQIGTGWLGRGLGSLKAAEGAIPAMHVGEQKLPMALQGGPSGVPSIHPSKPFELHLSDSAGNQQEFDGRQRSAAPPSEHDKARMSLIKSTADPSATSGNDLLQFVRRSSLQTYTAIDRLRELMKSDGQNQLNDLQRFGPGGFGRLAAHLNLVARLIKANFGTRIFYVYIDGFDTHAEQRNMHQQLLQQIADAVNGFFQQLEQSKLADRVVLMTFSEFGRRMAENGSRGTDHGAASCLFVAGPQVKGGLIGKPPNLAPGDLDGGDPRFTVDFRQVYATLLDRWLGIESRHVLGGKFEGVELVRG